MPEAKKTIFFVSTFPPRECGLATFTNDLILSFEKVFAPFITAKVIAMNDNGRNSYLYPPQRVVFQINQKKKEEYKKAAHFVNQAKPLLTCVQHEFGIFGGLYGSYITDFLKNVTGPRAVILHTVLPHPKAVFLRRMQELDQECELFIVMTKISKRILIETYNIVPKKISVIPHGVHGVSFEFSEGAKKEFGLKGHTVLTTFGLLGRNKGIEYVLRSLPAVIQKHPDVLYMVIGATHPKILQKEGEKYRKSLLAEVKKLGLEKHVKFYNKYFELKELIQILKATDIYIATSLDPFQAVSGTLSYAIGIGRPILSTSFSQAQEFVTPSIGTLVPLRDSVAYSEALLNLLSEPHKLHAMAYNAYSQTRHMNWSNVANAYYQAFVTIAPSLQVKERRLLPIKLLHFERMTTKEGILQFCQLSLPNKASGYTLDDNARALLAMALHHKETKSQTSLHLAEIYLDFVLKCEVEDGLLLNIFDFDMTPNEVANRDNREDAHTRTLFALSYTGTLSLLPISMKLSAQKKFMDLFKGAKTTFAFPRAQAMFVKALACQLQSKNTKNEMKIKCREMIEKTCTMLLESYREHASPEWEWFEFSLTYSNALLPEALFIGYAFTGNKDFLKMAEKTLSFLLEKTIVKNQVWPIGQDGWLSKGGERQYYDQQPEEVTALLFCLRTAWDTTGQAIYRESMEMVFSWFMGNNALGQIMYDEATGGCYDGLTPESVNLNEGSESAICYLLARLSMVHAPIPFSVRANRPK